MPSSKAQKFRLPSGKTVHVRAYLSDTGKQFFDPVSRQKVTYNRFRVGIWNKKQCVSGTFLFGEFITRLNRDDMQSALRQFAERAMNGMLSFQEFCLKRHLDVTGKHVERVYRGYRKAYEKARKIGITDNDLLHIKNNL